MSNLIPPSQDGSTTCHNLFANKTPAEVDTSDCDSDDCFSSRPSDSQKRMPFKPTAVSHRGLETESDSDDENDEPCKVAPSKTDAHSGITFISPFASAASAKQVVVPQIIHHPAPSRRLSNSPLSGRGPLSPLPNQFQGSCSPALATDSHVFQRRSSHIPPSQHLRFLASTTSDRDRRRRSVDTAVLNAQKHSDTRRASKRLRSDDDAEEYVAVRRESLAKGSGRESMFADHLSAILNHSLSLCAGKGETSLDLFARGEDVLPMPPSRPTTPGTENTGIFGLASPTSGLDTKIGSSPRSSLTCSTPNSQHFQQFRVKRQPSQGELTAARRNRLLASLQDWGFDGLSLDQDDLWESACMMFEAVLAMEGVEVGVNMDSIGPMISSLRSAYHARNGYHNFAHAVDVTQAIYSFLTAIGVAPPLSFLKTYNASVGPKWRRSAIVESAGGIGKIFRPMDVFSLMIAAIGHDVGHPGLSNAYMVNAKTPVAQVYGGESVLENFHLVTLIQMLRKHGLGHLFGNADRGPSFSDHDCRKVLFASVLATDMSRHFPFVAKLQALALRSDERARFDSEVDEDRLLLCGGLMKCADISNPTRPHAVAKRWSTALLEEWSVQAKIEAEFKLPVSVVLLNPSEAKAQAKSQVGFINLFTLPLFDAMTACLPELKRFSTSCREGRRTWEAVVLADEQTLGCSAMPPDSTPRLSASNLAAKDHNENAFPARRLRRPPPSPLVFANRSRQRPSFDSGTSSNTLSPVSPLFSPDARRQTSSFSSTYSIATTASLGEFSSRTQCTGTCGQVTAMCAECQANQIATASGKEASLKSHDSDETMIPMSGASTPGEELELCELWPPVAFWPSLAPTTTAVAEPAQ